MATAIVMPTRNQNVSRCHPPSDSMKPPTQTRTIGPTIALPEETLVEYILPYVDRVTQNRATIMSKCMYAAEKRRMESGKSYLSWPSGCFETSIGLKKSSVAETKFTERTSNKYTNDTRKEDNVNLIRQQLHQDSVTNATRSGPGDTVSFSPDGFTLSVTNARSGKIFIYNVRKGLSQIISEGGNIPMNRRKAIFAKKNPPVSNHRGCGGENIPDKYMVSNNNEEGPILASYGGDGLVRLYSCGYRCNADDMKEEEAHTEDCHHETEHRCQNEATFFVPKQTLYICDQRHIKSMSSFSLTIDPNKRNHLMMVSANWIDLQTYYVWDLYNSRAYHGTISQQQQQQQPKIFQARSREANSIASHGNYDDEDNDCVIAAIDIALDGSMIATGGSDGSLCLTETETGCHIATLSRPSPAWRVVGDLKFAPNCRHIAAVHHLSYHSRLSQKIRIWSDDSHLTGTGGASSPSSRSRIGTKKRKQEFHHGIFTSFTEKLLRHNVDITCISFSPNSNYLVGGCAHVDYSLLIWSVENGSPVRMIRGPGMVHDLAVSATAGAVAAGNHNGTFCLWTLQQVFPPSESSSSKPVAYYDEDFESVVEDFNFF